MAIYSWPPMNDKYGKIIKITFRPGSSLNATAAVSFKNTEFSYIHKTNFFKINKETKYPFRMTDNVHLHLVAPF